MHMSRYRLGIDVGGTFTDFCLLDEVSNTLLHYKVPSTPADPTMAIEAGLAALADLGVNLGAIGYFVHGTTLAINTILQRSGASIALFVTRGFRDLMEIQRLRLRHPFNFDSTRPVPLVRRSRVYEIHERIRADGAIEIPLDEASAEESVRKALGAGVDGFAVCLMHSYRNPVHEHRVKAIVKALAPGRTISCSVDVWPQMREYERATATVMNAYVQPRIGHYLGNLIDVVSRMGCRATPFITKSNGGVMTADRARTASVETLLSGPASGVIGAAFVAGQAGFRNLITLDMGGTSADIGIVMDGRPLYSTDEHIGEFPVILPTVAVSSIGAGGGSIAWLDAAGVLKVGPRSAGADPGPACYGRGGKEPTLTDAFLLAGLLNPEWFLGGRMRLDPAKAESALGTLGRGMGLDPASVAEAVMHVATSAMYSTFSSLLSKRGLDPREFCLVAFGGAGPLQACALAREFNIPWVFVPRSPGTLCAQGALTADVMNDYIRSLNVPLISASATEIAALYDRMRMQAEEWLRSEGPLVTHMLVQFSADTRYLGQAYEIETPVDPAWFNGQGLAPLAEAHHQTHQRVYAHSDRQSPVEIINLRLRVVGITRKPEPQAQIERGAAAPTSARTVRWSGETASVNVFMRERLAPGSELVGPAIVEQPDTTTFVAHGTRGRVDSWGNIVISVSGA